MCIERLSRSRYTDSFFCVGAGAPRTVLRSFCPFIQDSLAAYRVGLRLDKNTIKARSMKRFRGRFCFVSKDSTKQLSDRQNQQDRLFSGWSYVLLVAIGETLSSLPGGVGGSRVC